MKIMYIGGWGRGVLPALPPTGKSFRLVRACVRRARLENVTGIGSACISSSPLSLFPFSRGRSSLSPLCHCLCCGCSNRIRAPLMC